MEEKDTDFRMTRRTLLAGAPLVAAAAELGAERAVAGEPAVKDAGADKRVVPSADGVISKPSQYSVDETMRRLEEVVHGKGLTVFARIDHRAGAREVSLDMQDEQVLIFGNPRAGTPLMVARPLVGIDLPLRVLVWRDSNSRVWASYQDSAFIAKRFGLPGDLEKNIAAVAALVEAALR